jgi:hypothetical protein
MRLTAAASVMSALALSACMSFSPPPQQRITPLMPQPVNPVASQTLPPPVTPTMPQTGIDPMTGQPIGTMASASPTAPAIPTDTSAAADVRKPDLIGGWTLAAAGETCQLSMNLTTWTGGYRASTRGCASDELKAIGAWDVIGKEVLLKDASGSVVARLYAAAPNRYSGQTDVGKRGVQFFRG